eukprot:jgi/Hompol1/3957/HPOL_006848-RA
MPAVTPITGAPIVPPDCITLSHAFPTAFKIAKASTCCSAQGVTCKGTAITGLLQLASPSSLISYSISGTIPDALGSLKSLQTIDFTGLDFTGSIPSSFGNLVNLKSVTISTNELNGTIPDSFANLVNLAH